MTAIPKYHFQKL